VKNEELVRPQQWADPNFWGLRHGPARRRGERAVTILRTEIETQSVHCWPEFVRDGDAIQHRQRVGDFAKECSRLFSIEDPECLEEILCCGIALFVFRVSVALSHLICAMIDIALASMSFVNLFTAL
jgi:hypothetical protein